MLSLAGCESTTAPTASPTVEPIAPAELCSGYQATDIRIVGLSGFSEERYGQIGSQMEVVVEMLDSFGTRIKSPGVFRIELYEYLPRSNDPKGKRVFAWPDTDLTRPSDNNGYWRDFLRAYRFDLSMDMRPVNPVLLYFGSHLSDPRGQTLHGPESDFVSPITPTAPKSDMRH